MSDAAEQIEIELDDPEKKPEDAEIKVVKAEDATAKVLEPEEGLEKLKKQLDDEKKSNEANKVALLREQTRANNAEHAIVAAKTEVQDTNLSLVTNAIETVKQSQSVLRANYATAMREQDFDKVAEINEAMGNNSAKLLQLEQGKEALEKAPKPTAPVRQTQNDPVEALASQLSPRSASWVRAHPEYATNTNLYNKMIAAHNLVKDDHAADSDGYFSAIEDVLRIKPREVEHVDEDPTAQAAQATQRRVAPPAAPVSRSGTSNGSRPNVVRLSAAEREMAGMMGMSDTEYAKNKLQLQKDGKLPN